MADERSRGRPIETSFASEPLERPKTRLRSDSSAVLPPRVAPGGRLGTDTTSGAVWGIGAWAYSAADIASTMHQEASMRLPTHLLRPAGPAVMIVAMLVTGPSAAASGAPAAPVAV